MVEKIHLTSAAYQPHIQFWKKYFSVYGNGFSFRQKNSRNGERNAASYATLLPAKESGIVFKLVKDDDSGIFVCMLAALGIVLRKYSGQEKIVVHSPVLEASRPDYIQDIPLAMEPGDGSVLKDYLNSITGIVRECYSYQDLPIQHAMNTTTVALSNVLVRYDNMHSQAAGSPYDLSLSITRREDAIGLLIDYDLNAFDDFFIRDLCIHMARVIKYLERLDTRIADIDILDENDRQAIIAGFNDTKRDYPPDNTIVTLFEGYARETPSSVAIIHGGVTLTYDELNSEANRLARHLTGTIHVVENDIVAVMAESSPLLMIAILGVLKAGAAFLPIDPDLPDERKKFQLSDTSVKLLITDSTLFFQQDYYTGKAFLLDLELAGLGEDTGNPVAVNNPSALAYVIYTSGTTGVPKGVLLRRGGLANMVQDQMRQFGILPTDKVLQFASISFDASVSEMFMALCKGAQLVLIDRSLAKDEVLFLNFMKEASISVLTLPPSYLSVIHWEELAFLRVIISAGEKLNVKAALALSRRLDFFNAYGPTECTVCATINKIVPSMMEDEAESIGIPIANMQVYILAPDLQPVPVGIAGEIYIGGAGVARGYLHQPGLTDERFIPDPFSTSPDGRLYRTGDFGKWMQDGKISFSGRHDDQVKLRGYRVELGEIEHVLRNYDGIKQCAVLAKGDNQGDRTLVAFVVADDAFQKKEAIDYLRARLPEYMVPAMWITVNEMPLTGSDKVDKKALLALSAAGNDTGEHVAPRNAMEERLVNIWKEVLQAEQVGIYDDFFNIGGDSLMGIQVLSAIREEFSLNIPMNILFQFKTISDLAEYMTVIAAEPAASDDGESEILLL